MLRLMPSLTDLVFLLPIILLFGRMKGASQLLEGDTGWHIRTGDWILANGRIPYADLFSFTKPGEPWFAWEWLWDAAFAWLHARGGLPLVTLVSLFVISLTFALLYRLVARRSGNVLVAAAVTLTALAASSIHWWARPHVFTWLFAVITLHILETKREGGRDLLWILPPLTIVWTNVHGGFLFGIILVATYAAGELCSALVAANGELRSAAFRRGRPYLISGAACLAASFINPYTYHLHVHIANYLGNPDSLFFRFVGEWQSVSFHNPSARFFEVLIVASVAAAFWHASQRRWIEPLLIVSWLHQALGMGRNIPLFALVAALPTAQALAEIATRMAARADVAQWLRGALATFSEIGEEIGSMERTGRAHLISMAAFAVLALVMLAPAPSTRFLAAYDAKAYPVQAVAKLSAESRAGRIFAPDEWGDYLIYTLSPATKVFIDGRFDFYGNRFTEKYLDVMDAKYNWAATLDEYRVRFVLLPVEAPLASALKESSRWNTAYDDGVSILFRLRDEEVSIVTENDGRESGLRVTQVVKERKRTL